MANACTSGLKTTIAASELYKLLHDGNPDEILIDVREPVEYRFSHIPEAKNIPLGDLESSLEKLKHYGSVYVYCNSGNRSEKALMTLMKGGVMNTLSLEGGITEWQKAQLLTTGHRRGLPIMRQVMLTAGFLVLLGIVLAIFAHPLWLIMTMIVGAGLMFSGFTGLCIMQSILEEMPWNRVPKRGVAAHK